MQVETIPAIDPAATIAALEARVKELEGQIEEAGRAASELKDDLDAANKQIADLKKHKGK
jgi:septal ring factor EnvC (AmiA/AmiB activator)